MSRKGPVMEGAHVSALRQRPPSGGLVCQVVGRSFVLLFIKSDEGGKGERGERNTGKGLKGEGSGWGKGGGMDTAWRLRGLMISP